MAGAGQEVVAAAGQIADAVPGDEQDGDVVGPGLAEEARQAAEDALAGRLFVGQHQGADLPIGAVAGGRLDGVGHGLGVGVGELQIQVGVGVAADPDRQQPQNRAARRRPQPVSTVVGCGMG